MTLRFTTADRPHPEARCTCGWPIIHGQQVIVDEKTDEVTHATCRGRLVIEASVDDAGRPVDYDKWVESFKEDR